jgi:hypothetical protein
MNCYVYMITDLQTNKWYIGSRTAKGCSPTETNYYSSSKVVKSIYRERPHDLYKTVIACGSREDILNFERVLLVTLNAAADPMSYNKHNADSKFIENGWATRDQTGNNNVMKRPEVADKIRKHKTGKPRIDMMGDNNPYRKDPTLRQKLSDRLKGKKKSEEHISNWKTSWAMRPMITCPHCGLSSRSGGNMQRYHFDKCKHGSSVTTKLSVVPLQLTCLITGVIKPINTGNVTV